ncbi:MAG TPA: alpha/beta hydrolase [Crinalium sp.]
MSLQAIAIPAKSGKPKGLLVVLHGWGANAQDVAALASYLNLPDYQFIFPDAPLPHPYAPVGRMWYSFPNDYSFSSREDFQTKADLAESRRQLSEWLLSLEDVTGIPLSQTILGGFSQGGAMTLDVGLQLPVKALMVLSGFLHTPIQPKPETIPPILMVHGRQDPVVPIQAARQARDTLLGLGATVNYQEFDMGHEIQPIVLNIMQSFVGETALDVGETA